MDIMVTYISFRMEFNKKLSSLETELANLGPRKRVDADQVLKDKNSHVSDGKLQHHAVMILCVIYTR